MPDRCASVRRRPENCCLKHKSAFQLSSRSRFREIGVKHACEINNPKELEQRIETLQRRLKEVESSADLVEQLKKKQEDLQAANEELRVQARELTSSEIRLKSNLEGLTRIQELRLRLLGAEGLQPLLQEIMDAAVELMEADLGTLQLFDGTSLRITAQHGHKKQKLARGLIANYVSARHDRRPNTNRLLFIRSSCLRKIPASSFLPTLLSDHNTFQILLIAY